MASKRDLYKVFPKEEILTKRERKRRAGYHYSQEQKNACLALYCSEMTMVQISEQTGVPYRTIRQWKTEAWWNETLNEIRSDNEEIFRFRAHQIIDKATKVLLDRLDNGDEVILRDGASVRRQISGKDAAVIAAVIFDKMRISMNMPTAIHRHVDETNLKELAENFRKVAREMDAKVVGISDVHALKAPENPEGSVRGDGAESGSDGGEAPASPRNGTDIESIAAGLEPVHSIKSGPTRH